MLFDEIHHPRKLRANTALRRRVKRDAKEVIVTTPLYRGRKISSKSNSAEALFDLFEKPVFTSSFNRPLFLRLHGMLVY